MRKVFLRMVGAWLMAAASGALPPSPALAGDDRRGEGEYDHDRARSAVEHGDILPLEAILKAVRPSITGEIVGIELEKENGRWLYEFKVISGRGQLMEIHADARTGKVIKVEED